MSYKETHHAYCGMSIPLGDGFTHAEARERFEQRIAWFRRVIEGEVIRNGTHWAELCEPDDAMLVPDECGILRIEREDT